ncbi:hypothetical protein ONZ45_g10706 [Pleurotus djamor]|nr:hypothetical protein ONZ45_g10706 [Pleurotus djamor]
MTSPTLIILPTVRPPTQLHTYLVTYSLDPTCARAFGDAFYAIADAMEHESRYIPDSSNSSLSGGTPSSSTPSSTIGRIFLEPSTPRPSTSLLPSTSVEQPPDVIEIDDDEEEMGAAGDSHSFLRGLAFHTDSPPECYVGIWRIAPGYGYIVPEARPLGTYYLVIRGIDVGIFRWWSEARPLVMSVPHNLWRESVSYESAVYELDDAIDSGYAAVIRRSRRS